MNLLNLGKSFFASIAANVAIITTVFYVSGFLSFIAYYRVLGLYDIKGDVQTYAEFSGKNILLILQLIISLPLYIIQGLQGELDLQWGGLALMIAGIVLLLLSLLTLVIKFFYRVKFKEVLEPNKYLRYAYLLLLLLGTASVLMMELKVVSIQNVLFPVESIFDYANANAKKGSLKMEQGKILTEKLIDKRLKRIHAQTIKNNTNKVNLFAANDATSSTGGDDVRLTAFAMILFSVILLTFFIYLSYSHATVKGLALFLLISQAIYFPFLYGILGKSYQYPIVSLSYEQQEQTIQRQGVFLLATTAKHLIIYDRINFFSLDYIPLSTVKKRQQVAIGSPFSNCKSERFNPCELYFIDF